MGITCGGDADGDSHDRYFEMLATCTPSMPVTPIWCRRSSTSWGSFSESQPLTDDAATTLLVGIVPVVIDNLAAVS